jgi:putative DNA primase/helicase
MTTTTSTLLAAVQAAAAAGICVVPPCEDGTKRPQAERIDRATIVDELGVDIANVIFDPGEDIAYTWKHHQYRRPDVQKLREWYGNGDRDGMGAVTGAVSGNLEMLEFEQMAVYHDFRQAAAAVGLGALVERIERGYLERTPGGGVHMFTRCSVVAGNEKLACRPKHPDEMRHDKDRTQVLIETRGEGGFAVMAPSSGKVHPSGGAYEPLLGGFATIATITPEERADLWTLARTFDEMVDERPNPAEVRVAGSGATDTALPGVDFNQRATWDEVLEHHGWRRVFERGSTAYWRRPGKTHGISATTNHTGRDTFICFSSSTPFELSPSSYSKFGAYALLEHDGDHKAAAAALRDRGFGAPSRPQMSRNGAAGGSGYGSGQNRATHAPRSTPPPPPTDDPPLSERQTSLRERRKLTDLGNAERLIDRHGERLRYVTGWGWVVYDGRRWARDEDGIAVARLAAETVRSIYAEAAGEADTDYREALSKNATSSEQA